MALYSSILARIYNFIGNEDEMLKLVEYLVSQLNINKGYTDNNSMKNIQDDLHKLVTMIGSSKGVSLYPPSRGGKTKNYSLYTHSTHISCESISNFLL